MKTWLIRDWSLRGRVDNPCLAPRSDRLRSWAGRTHSFFYPTRITRLGIVWLSRPESILAIWWKQRKLAKKWHYIYWKDKFLKNKRRRSMWRHAILIPSIFRFLLRLVNPPNKLHWTTSRKDLPGIKFPPTLSSFFAKSCHISVFSYSPLSLAKVTNREGNKWKRSPMIPYRRVG